jgi:HAD superfamily hydrolase (TIGR01490 family)
VAALTRACPSGDSGLNVGRTGLAIFDLDRTLVPGSSLVGLAKALSERRIIGRATVARHVFSRVLFKRRGVGDGRVEALRTAGLRAVAGYEHAVLADVATVAGSAVAASAYPATRWLLERHLAAGDFCVILSAAPQELVEAVASALGAHRAVGTRAVVVEGLFTGELDGPFCYGAGKLERLAIEVGAVELHQACTYADSASDLPLLRASGQPVAVNPDRRLRRVARAAGWPVLHFDRPG